VPESAVPESAVPESAETVLAETVLAETVLAETVALKSHGSAERKALGSACWTAAPVPRRRNVSARGGVGSRAVPPLRARPYSQERATGLLLDTVVYWRVGPASQQPAWPQRQGRSAARSQWQWRAEEGLCWHPSGANHVCTQPRAYFAKRSPKHRKTKGSLCAEIA